MKKIFSVINGRIMLIIVNLTMAFCTMIIAIVLPMYNLGWLYLILFDLLLFVVPQLVFCFKFKCLNYITVSTEGIKHKDTAYSWDNVFITMVRVSAFGGYRYNFRIYFGDKYYTNKAINEANKKGFWIDLTEKRVELILSYYKKNICDLTKNQNNKGVYKIVSEHNRVMAEREEK